VFGCASLAVAQTADSCEEPVSLLQSDLQSRQRARRNALSASKDDSCQCLNWKQTFASGLVECGSGFEYGGNVIYGSEVVGQGGTYPSPEAWLSAVQKPKNPADARQWYEIVSTQWCHSFYEVIDDNKCVRAAMDHSDTEWWGKSWCYVSSACSNAMPISSPQVSVKFCQEGTDSLLSDMPPTEFIVLGRRWQFAFPEHVVQVAYPADPTFFWVDRAQHEAEVSKLKASGKPVVVKEMREPCKDRIIIVGNTVIRMKPAEVAGRFAHLDCLEHCDGSGVRQLRDP